MQDKYNLYHKHASLVLRTWRSQKYLRLQRIQSEGMGWFKLREAAMLQDQIIAIDAELEARQLQLPLHI